MSIPAHKYYQLDHEPATESVSPAMSKETHPDGLSLMRCAGI